MKTTHTCPKCRSRKFLVTPEFKIPDPSASNTTFPVPPFTARIAGFIGDRASAGTFEVWTCAQCGFTEWYAKGLETLDLSKMEGQVQFFDASAPAGGGYR
jgi:predicted nucleic-acid-binding Zn-ribbon protein